MDEAYKILTKEQHPHWDKFKSVHSEKIVNFVRYQLGEKVNKEDFINTYKRLTTSKHNKRGAGKRTYKFLKKFNWVK